MPNQLSHTGQGSFFLIKKKIFFKARLSFTIHFSCGVRVIPVACLTSSLGRDGIEMNYGPSVLVVYLGLPQVLCPRQEDYVTHNYFSLKQLEYVENHHILYVKHTGHFNS